MRKPEAPNLAPSTAAGAPRGAALIPLLLLSAALLQACGGGQVDEAASAQPAAAETDTGDTPSALWRLDAAGNASTVVAEPTFHVAPVLPPAPDEQDALDPQASAIRAPVRTAVPAALASLSTRGLTLETLQAARAMAGLDGDRATIQASGSSTVTYTPAQIRAAYGLPALPASTSGLSAASAAALGAGQTIYIVDAFHNPNAAAELAAFNSRFGLPTCTTTVLTAGSTLPLAKASTTACQFVVAYTTSAARLSSTAPAYNAGWAQEIALDVQWAHAIAPLARIVLIEAPDASTTALNAAVQVANAMGPGVVSMSFGSAEGSWTSTYDSTFSGSGMSYLAATGDSGAAVAWPSVSTRVLAVGGTSLSYGGSGARSETAWSSTGGGMSTYVARPSYQAVAVAGLSGYTRRAVADVAFNADPYTGQYTAVMAPGTTTPQWLTMGGTSMAAPQWAGLLAIANAQRVLAGKAVLGAPHIALYSQIGTVASSYAAAFADIKSGKNGSCSGCTAATGYDIPTGLGTPNASALLSALGGSAVTATTTATAPALASASATGIAGKAFSYAMAATAGNAVTYALSGAPSGLSINAAGTISWASPVVGSYSITVTATDTVNGLKGQAVLTLSVVKAGTVVTTSGFTGVAGKALSGTITLSNATAQVKSIALSGVPAGMGFTTSGLTMTGSWPSPVTGTYTLKLVVTDSAGASVTVNIPVTVTAK